MHLGNTSSYEKDKQLRRFGQFSRIRDKEKKDHFMQIEKRRD